MVNGFRVKLKRPLACVRLCSPDKVGDVTKAIDSRSASYLANTGDMGKAIAPETEKVILDSADKQHYHEKKGLVKSEADKGEIPQEVRDAEGMYDRAGARLHNLNAMLQAEKAVPTGDADASSEGVVHTEDGYVLRIDKDAAGSGSPMRPMSSKAQLAMLADVPEVDPREATVDGCLCAGSSDEDKGPKCSCIGDPSFPKVDEVFSPSEITNWGHEVHQQSQFKGATLQKLRTAGTGTGKGKQAVEATADGINSYLEDVQLGAQERKGAVDKSKLAHLRATIKQLQDTVMRDPQSRDLVARRLSLLKSSVHKAQMLQDYDSVYLAPYVDDLDNYLQGVLDEVNRVEIPSLEDDDEDKAVNVKGAQTLKATSGSVRFPGGGSAVLPDTRTIKQTLAALVTAADKLSKVPKGKMAHLKQTVKAVELIAEKVPESRDLLAERLTQYKARQAIKSNKAGTTSLQDYDSVYLAPYVDDLDNYLQGVLDEVNRVEIPSLEDDDEDKAVGAAASLKARTTALLPLDPTKHRHDLNNARKHGGYDETSGPNPSFAVPPVPELGEFRDKVEWQHHPFDRHHAEAKQFWKESEDDFPPQDATMVFGAGRLRRESKTQAVHNPYGWLGAKGAEVPVTTADSEDTRTGGMFGGYGNGAGVATRKSLEAGSKLCQLVNCDNRGAIPFPPAAHARQHGLQMALAEEAAEPAERERPFLGDEIFDLGVDNGYNNGDVIMDSESAEGHKNLTPMYYWARKQRTPALAHWNKANALLASAQRSS